MLDLKKIELLVKQAANEILIPRFGNVEIQKKSDQSIVTEADHLVQAFIQKKLAELHPDHLFLGEETLIGQQQAVIDDKDAGYWCLDPLDGTNNFTYGIPYFAISLAYIEGNKKKLGVVFDPIRDECFSALAGKGAWLNGKTITQGLTPRSLSDAIALVDFKRLPDSLHQPLLINRPYGAQRNMGASALDWCWVAAGRFHVYLHGRQSLWDYAAGALILSESGGQCFALDDNPLYIGTLKPRPAVGAVTPELFDQWFKWLKQF
jgi:myo-inositol-1(or 4)-monophosphatase